MKIIKRNKLRRGGFAGLRETRLVMSPRVFRRQREAGTSAGIGRFVYLADASFLPNGDTRMHDHREIDVISIMVEGRIQHEGSLEDGQELEVDSIQVQRAGGEGFSHNEINPDASKNRMVQVWVMPESPGEPAAYKVFQAEAGKRTRVYGGPTDQDETISSRTVIEIAHVNAGKSIKQPGRSVVYMTEGDGTDVSTGENEALTEGDLVETRDFSFKASRDSKLILAYEI
jgi:redox-sensitive bicupin YhaK (pirin superfamily)